MADDLTRECCTHILNELANAGFEWWEYPTLIDAIEQHVEAALLAPNRVHIDTTATLAALEGGR